VPGRLFQSFQQRIESRIGDLMGFIKNVNLEAITRRAVARGLAQLTNFVNAAIGSSVDLDYIHSITGANLGA
jgi:hypothetical protein